MLKLNTENKNDCLPVRVRVCTVCVIDETTNNSNQKVKNALSVIVNPKI